MNLFDFDPNYVFEHHAPTPEKLVHYDAIHAAAKAFAIVILKHTPPSEDQRSAYYVKRR